MKRNESDSSSSSDKDSEIEEIANISIASHN